MLNLPPAHRVFYLDVETVAQKQFFKELSPEWQCLWAQKAKRIEALRSPEELYPQAGIYAEFGKIVCISVGSVDENSNELTINSFYGFEEKPLLISFSRWSQEFLNNQSILVAHNGKEFDFPWIARRMAIQGITVPKALQLFGKKPWEIPHIDTLELWKCGDYKHYTSLELLAATLEIPSPKSHLSGSKIYAAFYEELNITEIATYCAGDVETLARLVLKLKGGMEIQTVKNRYINCAADHQIFSEIAAD
jgi:DNA polymerase elongation subunit (family B)